MSYWFNPEEIERRLNEVRNYLKKNIRSLDWKKEGELLDQIETLKRDLSYAKLLSETKESKSYSSHVLEMKIKFG